MNRTLGKNKRNEGGFTLVETLTVVAVATILMALSFVAVINIRRSMLQMELDATAKEIYVAAQNHLLTAKDAGLLNKQSGDRLGALKSGESDVCYFVYDGSTSGDKNSPEGDGKQSVLGLMLPYGSLDDTVRTGGSYIVEYQHSTGMITSVFFAKPHGIGGLFGAFGAHAFSQDEAEDVLALTGEENSGARRDYGGAVIGWCGGESVEQGSALEPLSISIVNGDKLLACVTDPNALTSAKAETRLTLTIKGEKSGASATVVLRGPGVGVLDSDKSLTVKKKTTTGYYFEYALDDITNGGKQFQKQFKTATTIGTFIPGEDIEVTVTSMNTVQLANVVSASAKTNSLFAEVTGDDAAGYRASIKSLRHLENLDPTISGLKVSLVGADLQADLSWSDFLKNNGQELSVYKLDSSASTKSTMFPVNPTDAIDFNGNDHKISDVAIRIDGPAGLFGTLKEKSSVKSLELVDFSVTSSQGSAGALVGEANSETNITDVSAYESVTTNQDGSRTTKKNVITGATNVGGLVGSLAKGTIARSFASMLVKGTSENAVAGGLVGTTTESTIERSYAAGHTTDGAYATNEGNVDSQGIAGGLVGSAVDTSANLCYATCSVFGTRNVGGFVGSSTNGSVANSYATGLMSWSATNVGAFAGLTMGTTFQNNLYLNGINFRNSIRPVGSNSEYEDGIAAADASLASYQQFAAGTRAATAYDAYLNKYYAEKYPYRTVADLELAAGVEQLATTPHTHCGDWPSPEAFTVNQAGGSASTSPSASYTGRSVQTHTALLPASASWMASDSLNSAEASSENQKAPEQESVSANGKEDAKELEELSVVSVESVSGPTQLEKTVGSADGHTYTVRVSYDAAAKIPSNAELSVVEYNTLPSDWFDEQKQATTYKNRPFDSEQLLDSDAMANYQATLKEALELGESDRMAWNKFLNVTLISDGVEVQPATAIQVEIETNAVSATASDSLEVALVSGDDSYYEAVVNTTGTQEGEDQKELNELKARISFSANELGEFGLAEVVEKKSAWTMYGDKIVVYGARSAQTRIQEVPLDMEYLNGMRLIEVFEASVDTERPFNTALWVEAAENEEADASYEGVSGCLLHKEGELERIFGVDGTNGLVEFSAGDCMALVWESGLHDTVIRDGNVALVGKMPEKATVSATDVTSEYNDATSLVDDSQKSEAQTVAAYDLQTNAGDVAWQPDADNPVCVTVGSEQISKSGNTTQYAVLHVSDEGTTDVVKSKASDGSISFSAADAGTYVVVSYTVDFHLGDLSYSIAGESDVLLSELLKQLGVNEVSVKDVQKVTFSNEELVRVEQVEGDWKLTSLKPFSTEESLELMLANGSTITIRVTDAQGITVEVRYVSNITNNSVVQSNYETLCTINNYVPKQDEVTIDELEEDIRESKTDSISDEMVFYHGYGFWGNNLYVNEYIEKLLVDSNNGNNSWNAKVQYNTYATNKIILYYVKGIGLRLINRTNQWINFGVFINGNQNSWPNLGPNQSDFYVFTTNLGGMYSLQNISNLGEAYITQSDKPNSPVKSVTSVSGTLPSQSGETVTVYFAAEPVEIEDTSKEVCQIVTNMGTVKYETLAAAFDAAHKMPKNTATIEMLKSCTLDSELTVDKNDNITLTTADGVRKATITRGFNGTHMFNVDKGSLTFDNVVLDGNKTNYTGVDGGIVYVAKNGTLVVDENAVLQNSKSVADPNDSNKEGEGGAIYVKGGTLELSGTIDACETVLNGGGIYAEKDGNNPANVTITGTIKNCVAAGNGGAIKVSPTVVISMSSGTITGNQAQNGGGIYLDTAFDLTGGTFSNNSATKKGGAIYVSKNASLKMSAGSLEGNTSADLGGAIYVSTNSSVEMTGGTITGNSSTESGGSAISISDSSSFEMSGGSITNNTSANGGAVNVGGTGSRLKFLSDAYVYDNTCEGAQSNVYLNKDSNQIINAKGLGTSARIGVYVSDDLMNTYGVAGTAFGTFETADNLGAFINDRDSLLTGKKEEDEHNNLIYWPNINVNLVKLTVKFLWDERVPEEQKNANTSISFSIRGVRGDQETILPAYTSRTRTNTAGVVTSDEGYQKVVYVPDAVAEGEPFESYTLAQGTLIAVNGAGTWNEPAIQYNATTKTLTVINSFAGTATREFVVTKQWVDENGNQIAADDPRIANKEIAFNLYAVKNPTGTITTGTNVENPPTAYRLPDEETPPKWSDPVWTHEDYRSETQGNKDFYLKADETRYKFFKVDGEGWYYIFSENKRMNVSEVANYLRNNNAQDITKFTNRILEFGVHFGFANNGTNKGQFETYSGLGKFKMGDLVVYDGYLWIVHTTTSLPNVPNSSNYEVNKVYGDLYLLGPVPTGGDSGDLVIDYDKQQNAVEEYDRLTKGQTSQSGQTGQTGQGDQSGQDDQSTQTTYEVSTHGTFTLEHDNVADGNYWTRVITGLDENYTYYAVETQVDGAAVPKSANVRYTYSQGNQTATIINRNTDGIVILKKTDEKYEPLAGARFRIFRDDGVEVTDGIAEGETSYVSDASGIYFLGTMVEGTYYVVEIQAPSNSSYANNAGRVYSLTVDAVGNNSMSETPATTLSSALSETDMVKAFREWLESQGASS